MNEILKIWLDEINAAKLNNADTIRSLNYAHDLERGLSTIRTYPQGVSIFGSARLPITSPYCKSAHTLGALLAKNGHTVITGGGPGIMQAANRGAFEAGGRSIGLNITLSHEQHPNPYLTDMLEFRYFFARKVMLTFSSKCYVFYPGGFGTLDEFSEILLLIQEHKMPPMPIFLIGKSFWRPLDTFFKTKMLPLKTIIKSDRTLYHITDDITQIITAANQIGHPPISENLYDHFSPHL
jgi:uncharacterized protein (TIGR00730 family)